MLGHLGPSFTQMQAASAIRLAEQTCKQQGLADNQLFADWSSFSEWMECFKGKAADIAEVVILYAKVRKTPQSYYLFQWWQVCPFSQSHHWKCPPNGKEENRHFVVAIRVLCLLHLYLKEPVIDGLKGIHSSGGERMMGSLGYLPYKQESFFAQHPFFCSELLHCPWRVCNSWGEQEPSNWRARWATLLSAPQSGAAEKEQITSQSKFKFYSFYLFYLFDLR